MNLKSKFLFFRKKEVFEASKDQIPKDLNPIVFLEDAEEIYTCGKYFSFSSPNITVGEQDSSVNILIGKEILKFSTSGDGISIRKGTGDEVIINSTALTNIKTDDILNWNLANKILSHKLSESEPGLYGSTSLIPNASIFPVPYYSIDKAGHIVQAGTYNVLIRDYVELLKPTTDNVERNILSSYEAANNNTEDGQVRKTNGLTYNDFTQKITSPGGMDIPEGGITIIKGDIILQEGTLKGKVEGDFTGTAVPKIHLSEKPEYGGASKGTFGHVKLVDEIIGIPAPSSDNLDTNNANIEAAAASPYLVYLEGIKIKLIIEDKPNISSIITDNGVVTIDTSNKSVKFTGTNGITTSLEGDNIIINGVPIKAFNALSLLQLMSSVNFTKDFVIDSSNNLSLSWEEIG